eukprot:TRINITY_DN28778_c0_g1_i1.p1 TRINITY_DN28778_c0_g1~~TRINITY_DN28778_c0_g1_i1.p1  ORF type:complete len:280 (-),score=57.23 TRINITY_DN28778_c0_g1_i1:27-866(-)
MPRAAETEADETATATATQSAAPSTRQEAYKVSPPQPQLPEGLPHTQGYRALVNCTDLVVRQKVDKLEVATQLLESITGLPVGWEQENRYQIWAKLNGQPAPFAYAREEWQCCSSLFFAWQRGFVINLTAPPLGPYAARPLLRFERPFACCMPHVIVKDNQTGEQIGAVQQTKCGMVHCTNQFQVQQSPYTITGGCCCPTRFAINDEQGQEVGFVQKSWTGFLSETLTDADTFALTLPPQATAEQRAALVAAVLLIDFVFFEGNQLPEWICIPRSCPGL